MDRPFHDARRRQPMPADGQASALGDGDDADGPRFLPPLRRSRRSDRSAVRSRPLDDDDLDGLTTLPAWAELTDDWPPPPVRPARPPKTPPAPAPRKAAAPSASPRAAVRAPAPAQAPPVAVRPAAPPTARPAGPPAGRQPVPMQRPTVVPAAAATAARGVVPPVAAQVAAPVVAPVVVPVVVPVVAPVVAPSPPSAAKPAQAMPEPASPQAAEAAPMPVVSPPVGDAPLLFDAAQLQEVAQWLQPAPLPEPGTPVQAEPPVTALPAAAEAPVEIPDQAPPPTASATGDGPQAAAVPAQSVPAAAPPVRPGPPPTRAAATSIEAAWGGAGRAQAGAAAMAVPTLPFPGQPPLPGLPMRRPPHGRWLRPDFPWLAPRSIGLLASAVIVGGLAASLPSLMGSFSPPASAGVPVAQRQLRQLIGQMEECRGTESLLVMLPAGPERTATLARLQAQQRRIDVWLRDNGAWVAASQGAQAATELREASAAWRVQQQRIADADATQVRTGLAREARQLFTGPSSAAYRHMLQLVERMTLRQAS